MRWNLGLLFHCVYMGFVLIFRVYVFGYEVVVFFFFVFFGFYLIFVIIYFPLRVFGFWFNLIRFCLTGLTCAVVPLWYTDCFVFLHKFVCIIWLAELGIGLVERRKGFLLFMNIHQVCCGIFVGEAGRCWWKLYIH